MKGMWQLSIVKQERVEREPWFAHTWFTKNYGQPQKKRWLFMPPWEPTTAKFFSIFFIHFHFGKLKKKREWQFPVKFDTFTTTSTSSNMECLLFEPYYWNKSFSTESPKFLEVYLFHFLFFPMYFHPTNVPNNSIPAFFYNSKRLKGNRIFLRF